VLRPLAEARGLATWEEIAAFAEAPWFPSRIAFGKFKGRPFRDALSDPDLHQWLGWLAGANNPRSAEMGRWYLAQLEVLADAAAADSMTVGVMPSDGGELVLFRDPELETLRQLIACARSRLGELEAEYTQEHHAVEVVQSQLFVLLRPHYERRDALRLKIHYRRKFLDTLLIEGEEEAEAVEGEFAEARAETEREYEEAAAGAAETKALSAEEQRELKTLFKKLARLYHPDRYAHEPEKQEVYDRLMQEINQARDRGDIATLREIANDANGFLLRQGMSALDFDDDEELARLRQLYETLQGRILSLLDELERLRASGDYELYKLSRERPEFVQEVADQEAEAIATEIADLEAEAEQLAREIEGLTGADDPFRE